MRLRASLLVFSAALGVAALASAHNPWVVFPPAAETLPAVRYANLTGAACLAELRARGLPVEAADHASRNIDAPVLLPREVRGVAFEFKPSPQQTSALDCRLLLALDDLAGVAAARDIALVRYNSIHRRGWARGRVQGHLGGVAIDIVELVKRDGTLLNVLKDFAGDGIGSATCGAAAKPAPAGKASELRDFMCALDRTRSFNLLLGPHYDYRHRNHFHFEVRRGVRWFLTE